MADQTAVQIIAAELIELDASPADVLDALANAGYGVIKLDSALESKVELALIGGSYRADSKAVVDTLCEVAGVAPWYRRQGVTHWRERAA